MFDVHKVPVWLVACGLIWAQGPTEVTPQPKTAAQDLAAGERIYRIQCAYCHGTRGDGGRGATLARPKLRHAPDDRAMFQVIAGGIPESEMPGHWLTAHEIWQVVAYVRTLGRVVPEKVSGDPVRGQALYTKSGCGRCHTIGGRGGALGPDLTDIGSRRSTTYLRAAIVTPEGSIPDGFLELRLTTRDGRAITGVRLNEDAFSIQIRDLSDNFQSFWKDDLAGIERQRGKSPMPAYQTTFSAIELDDLVAYLTKLVSGQ